MLVHRRWLVVDSVSIKQQKAILKEIKADENDPRAKAIARIEARQGVTHTEDKDNGAEQ